MASTPEKKSRTIEALCLEHTSLLYPRHGSKGFKDLDLKWLQEEAHWPLAVKRRIDRYMHSHNLYEVPDASDESFGNLLRHFIVAANFPDTRLTAETVSSRCSALIYSSAQKWRLEGLLVMNERNKLVKSPIFEQVWSLAVESAVAERASRKMSARKSVDPGDQALPPRLLCSPEPNDLDDGFPRKRACEITLSESPLPKKTRATSPITDINDVEEYTVVSVPRIKAKNVDQAITMVASDLPLLHSSDLLSLRSDSAQSDKSHTLKLDYASFASPTSPLDTTSGITSPPDSQTTSSEPKAQYMSLYSPSTRISTSFIAKETTKSSELLGGQDPYTLGGWKGNDLSHTSTPNVVQSLQLSYGTKRNDQPLSTFSKMSQQPTDAFHGKTKNYSEHHSTGATIPGQSEVSSVPNKQCVAPLNRKIVSMETNDTDPDSCMAGDLEQHDTASDTYTLDNPDPPRQLSTAPSISVSVTMPHLENTPTQHLLGPVPTKSSPEPWKDHASSPPQVGSCDQSSGEMGEQRAHPKFVFMDGPNVTAFVKMRREKPRYVFMKSSRQMHDIGVALKRASCATLSISDPTLLAPHSRILQPCNNHYIPISPLSDGICGPSPDSDEFGDGPRGFPITSTDVSGSPLPALHGYGSSIPKSNATTFLDERPSMVSSTPATPNIPPLTFSACNRVISNLCLKELHQAMSAIEQTARIITGNSRNAKLWPINIILSQNLLDFYNWYAKRWELARKSPTRTLSFAFLDVPWEAEGKFILPADNSDRFRMLKQCIWNLFWTANYSKKRLTNERKWSFRIRIEPADNIFSSHDMIVGSSPQTNVVNDNPSSSPVSGTLPNNHFTVLPPIRVVSNLEISQTSSTTPATSTIVRPAAHIEKESVPPALYLRFDQGQSSPKRILTQNEYEISHQPAPTSIPGCPTLIPASYKSSNFGSCSVSETQPHSQQIYHHDQQPLTTQTLTSHPQPDDDSPLPSPPSPDPPPSHHDLQSPDLYSSKPDITLRLQLSPCGPFSLPYPKVFLDPAYTTTHFFAWFVYQTSYAGNSLSKAPASPRGAPNRLRFTFKDANPRKDGRLQCKDVEIGNEKQFRLLGDTVEQLYTRTWRYFPGAKEWVILVTALPDSRGSEHSDNEARAD